MALAEDSPSWLEGRVADSKGRPIEGARVVYRDTYSELEGVTDADGRYHIDDLDSEADEVTAAAPGYPPVVQIARPSQPGANALDFVLLAGDLDLAGRVIGSEGEPLQGIEVSWQHRSYDGVSEALTHTKTSADGSFRFRGVPEGLCYVNATDPFRQWAPAQRVDAGSVSLRIVLRPAGVIEGRVTNIDSGPITVFLDDLCVAGPQQWTPWAPIERKPVEPRFRLEMVPPERHLLQVRKEGVGAACLDVEVRAGEVTKLEVRLVEGDAIEGRVEAEEDGSPIPEATVVAVSRSEVVSPLFTSDPQHLNSVGAPHARTGADGSFRVTNLARGEHWVAAHAPGRIPRLLPTVEVPANESPVLRLYRAGILEVTGAESVEIHYPSGASRSARGTHVVWDDLPTGRYEIEALVGPRRDGLNHGMRRTVLVREGSTTRTSFRRPDCGRRLTIRARHDSREWPPPYLYALWREGDDEVWIVGRRNGDDRYSFFDLPLGRVEILEPTRVVRPPRGPGATVEVTEEEDREVEVEFHQVVFRVRDRATGEPVVSGYTDRATFFGTKEQLDPVVVQAVDRGAASVLHPPLDEETDLRLPPASSLVVDVRAQDGRWLHGARVSVLDAVGVAMPKVLPGARPPDEDQGLYHLAPGEYRLLVDHPDYVRYEQPLLAVQDELVCRVVLSEREPSTGA